MTKSWEELGQRVMAARKEQGFTQGELAAVLHVDRTIVTKIETGQRTVDSFELAQLAEALRRPIGWFVGDTPPAVVSRRAEREHVVRREDVQLETLAQDVEQLIALDLLQPPALAPFTIDSIEAAEAAATATRRAASLAATEPVWEIVTVVERLGLFVFVLELERREGTQAEGSYIALARGGVALIGNEGESGRRRFTIAHELGHHVLADQFAPEWIVGAGATEREKIINAFAIHFLMPCAAVEARWRSMSGPADPRDAAIRIAVEFGVSWSATCAQLQRAGCITEATYEALVRETPSKIELVERELHIRSDVTSPLVPPTYAAAVIRALKKGRIGATRALELLRGTINERDIPADRPLTLEAITAELDVLPA